MVCFSELLLLRLGVIKPWTHNRHGSENNIMTWSRDAEVWAFGHAKLLSAISDFDTRAIAFLKLFQPESHGAILAVRAYVKIKTKANGIVAEFRAAFTEISGKLGTPPDITLDALNLK